MSLLSHLPDEAQIILTLAVMLFAGFGMTRLTKRLHLPHVTGYILAGVVLGPYVLHIVPTHLTDKMGFVTDMALAFIAFGVGRYFKLSKLKEGGWQVLVLTASEALVAALAVTLTMALIFRLPLPFCLLLGAIGSATAPASTLMTIRQLKARGPFVNTVLEVVALDDAVSLMAFSLCAAAASALLGDGQITAADLGLPLVWNLLSLLAGAGAGVVLHRLVDHRRNNDHALDLMIATILAITGLCVALDISPLLSCMALGMTYINVGGTEATFDRVSQATPPILMCFFLLAGIRLDLTALPTAGLAGIVYFFVRILGKYLGAWAGAKATGLAPEIQKYLGLALIPQAGVSIGLAALGERILPPDTGALLSTIILSSGVLYELVGPACAKLSLKLSGSVPQRGPAGPGLTEQRA